MNDKHYYTLDSFYKKKFGKKVFKVNLNLGFGCPHQKNGGCIFCAHEGGEFAGNKEDSILKQFTEIKERNEKKWPDAYMIGYFQAGTNTYASLEVLKKCYETVLGFDGVVGLSIATRSDCISKEVMDYLERLNERTFLTVELGLQSAHEKTLKFIRRGHSLENFTSCVKDLKKRGINVVVHIINGLPFESKEDMVFTAKFLNDLGIDGIKIHMLCVLENTYLGNYYKQKPFHLLSLDEYVDIVCEQLRVLNKNIVIHRVTSDPILSELIGPKWLVKKFVVLNSIDKEMRRKNIYQGDLVKDVNFSNGKAF